MGWKGAGYGLGKDQQGIATPIEVEQIRKRSGIGCHHNYDQYFEEIMQIDASSNTQFMSTQPTTSCKNNINQTTMSSNFNSNSNANSALKQKRFNHKEFRRNIQKLLNNFISSVTENDLVFEKGLNTEQRAVIHQEASRYGLKTKSQGNGENRFLVAQKKRSTGELYESIKKNGGQFNNYELVSKGEID